MAALVGDVVAMALVLILICMRDSPAQKSHRNKSKKKIKKVYSVLPKDSVS